LRKTKHALGMISYQSSGPVGSLRVVWEKKSCAMAARTSCATTNLICATCSSNDKSRMRAPFYRAALRHGWCSLVAPKREADQLTYYPLTFGSLPRGLVAHASVMGNTSGEPRPPRRRWMARLPNIIEISHDRNGSEEKYIGTVTIVPKKDSRSGGACPASSQWRPAAKVHTKFWSNCGCIIWTSRYSTALRT
jgi:hypothetical protein